MRYVRQALLCGLVAFSIASWSQNVKITIPAGTPEDKDLANISAENDAGKRLAMYQDFAKKYADNKPAFAYAEWQISQQYLADGKPDDALAAGDKALELIQQPRHHRFPGGRGAGAEGQ